MLTRSRARLAGVGVLAALAVACADSPTTVLPPLVDPPAELSGIIASNEGKPSAPYMMLELVLNNGFSGFVLMNQSMEPVWLFRTNGAPFGFARRRNGNFVMLDNQRGLFEVTRDNQVAAMLPQVERPGRRMHHDVAVTAQDKVLFLAENWQNINGVSINCDAVWEWDVESGVTRQRWSAFDFLDANRDFAPRSLTTDWLHTNSLSVGAHGNIVLSFRWLNQVISIAPDFASTEWRMGGLNATIPVDDPFSGQHAAQEIAKDRILLFDNGNDRTSEPYSRAAEYRISAGNATKVWQWRPPDHDNWARAISSARRLGNGHTVICFGTHQNSPPGATGPIEIYEVDTKGDVVWHVIMSSTVGSMYRATPLMSF